MRKTSKVSVLRPSNLSRFRRAGGMAMFAGALLGLAGCAAVSAQFSPPGAPSSPARRDYRAEMRAFVREISARGKAARPGFIVIPQNGTELVTLGGSPGDAPALEYLSSIDGLGREELFYGYSSDDEATPPEETLRLLRLLEVAAAKGVRALVTDYCQTRSKVEDSLTRCDGAGLLCFPADRRELDGVPVYPDPPFRVNDKDVHTLSQAANFLYLLNQSAFATRRKFIETLAAARHDLFIIDAYFDGAQPFTAAEIERLRRKPGGGRRLVIAYLAIGEAENYRPYWKRGWAAQPPAWLAEENPDWPGNFKVRYWDEGWRRIILGKEGCLELILRAEFDGVYLDNIDAFEYFESIESSV